MNTPRSFFIGLGFSIAIGLLYFYALHESGAAFYPCATLAFIGGPLIAALLATGRSQEKVRSFFAAGGGVFGVVFALFILVYAIWPQFQRTSIELPPFCNGISGAPRIPTTLAYVLPGHQGTGILVAENQGTAIVATLTSRPPNPSNVYVVDTKADRILHTLTFPNDTIMAAVDGGIAYIYNDKLGYWIDARTGAFRKNIFVIDNYGGLSQSDRPVFAESSTARMRYVETSAVISSWGVDGSVRSRPFIFLNTIARGCYVNGATGSVIKL